MLLTGLMVLVSLLGAACFVWAGGNEDPPTTGTIVGPELWGVMIYDCGQAALVLRVKRIVNCNVETQAMINLTYSQGCPTDEASVLWRQLGVTLFDINSNPTTMNPIITKVKNFKKEPNLDLYSFDVQIKFLQP
jgi:hypothetical protein